MMNDVANLPLANYLIILMMLLPIVASSNVLKAAG